MFSHCDLTAELDLQDNSSHSDTFYPEQSNNSTYYEENALYSITSEPRTECYKSSKAKPICSPVEIHQESTLSIDLPPISWHNYHSVPKILNVINTGRTILINGHWTKNRPYITGGPLNGNYIFSQIHFHSPSEHKINGKRFPLEMHVVHYKTCYLTQEKAMEEKDGTVVIVYLFQVLNSKKSVLSSVMDSIHLVEGVNDRTELTNIALNQILQPVVSNYYIYWGSVSTSKNSYSLQWIISCSYLCVTQNEMDKLIKILCSNESFVESHASQMNVINNVIYHVEEYDSAPEETKCRACSNVTLACYCRYHCRNCKICVIHKEEYLQLNFTESRPCAFKESDKRDKELQTSSCEKTSKATSKTSLCVIKQVPKDKKKEVKITVTSSCSSLNSNSQSSVCRDKKKTKKKKDAHKVPSFCTPKCNDPGGQKQIDFTEPETCSSSASAEKKLKIKFCAAVKSLEKKDQKAKRKKVQKSEASSCDTLKSSSKGSMKSFKTPNKKRSITKNNSEGKISDSSSKSNKSNKKEKQTSKHKRQTNDKQRSKKNKKSESSLADSSKSSEGIKKEKKKKESKKTEKLQVQCMPVLVSTDKREEELFEIRSNFLEEKKEEGKVEKLKKEIENFPAVCEELLQPLKNLEADKTSKCLESADDIKTIFEKKRSVNDLALDGNDYTINFLLAPNPLQKKHSFMTSESECLEIAKNINSNSSSAVDKSVNKIPKLEISSVKSQEQPRDICFETEHFFHTERKGDFATCVTQEYNVAVICNHNIIQEFRGTFHPNDLELGMYEKLHLTPKYPDPENISVRLENCFVKKETLDQLYIRVKFLIEKVNINGIETKAENVFKEEIKTPDLKLSVAKNNAADCVKEEKHERDNVTEKEKNSNQSDLKSEVLEDEEYKAVLLKKSQSTPKQSNKSITFDSLEQPSKPKEMERKENNLIEKTDKTIKDLFCKRKKVYFSCEKVEKDENSGRKVFVGSFKTKKELKSLSKEKKSAQETDVLTSNEVSLGTDKEKFMSSSEESFEELLKPENPKAQQEYKFQSPAKSGESDKSEESQNLITIHRHKPKNFQVNGDKDERQNIESENQEIVIPSEIFSLKDKKKSEKPDVGPSSVRSQKLSHDKSQIAVTVIPIAKKSLSKAEVISNEHLKNVKKSIEKKRKNTLLV